MPEKVSSLDMDGLVEVRCPFKKPDNNGRLRVCNKMCVKIRPTASGEVWCRNCKKAFAFEVKDQQIISKTFVKAKTVKSV